MAFGRNRVRSLGISFGAWLEKSSYLQKWVILGSLIGIIAGLGAVVFYKALYLSSGWFLKDLAGYQIPTPIGEGNLAGSTGFIHPWIIPLVVALGGLLSGVLVFSVAPEAEGHGTDAAIEAVHLNPREIRGRTVLIKIVASALTIGSGGSGGREGPTAQISAGFGSFLARALNLSHEDGRTALSVGIGSGIGAIFGAPLGGAVLCADIIYRDDFEVAALIPGLMASIISYTIFGFFENFKPLFGYVDKSYQFSDPVRLIWYGLIGIAAGIVGLIYSKSFYGISDFINRLPGNRMFKPAVGGLLVGLMALAMPQVLGTGYGWIQKSLGPQLLSIPLWIVLLLPFARILATSLSIGSGGSGGIFGPGMVIGAFTGAAVWRVLEPIAPSIPHNPAPFVIVGMMSCFGSISRSPLSIMIMVAEMTGSLSVIPPAMIAVGIAYLIVRRNDGTIYRSQLKNKSESLVSRLEFGLPLLSKIKISEAMTKPKLVLEEGTTTKDALGQMEELKVPGAPVVNSENQFLGTVSLKLIQEASQDKPSTLVGRLVNTTSPSVSADTTLDNALEALSSSGGWVSALDLHQKVQGIVSTSDLVNAYHRFSELNANQLSQVASNAVAVEGAIGKDSPLVGHALRENLLPQGAVVVSAQRDNSLIFGVGGTILQAGDIITVFARPELAEKIKNLISQDSFVTLNPSSENANFKKQNPQKQKRKKT